MDGIKFGMMLMYPLPRPIQRIYGLSKRIEELGFDSIWLADHLLFPGASGFTVEAWSVLSAIAAKTEKVKLVIGVTDPHRRHPALLAQTAATIDQLSNGRLILGIGAGEGMNLNPFGIECGKPVSKMVESIDVMRRLWGSSESNKFDFNGDFYSLKKAYLDFKPIQEIIPIYMAANGPRTRRICGEIADGWIPIVESPETYKKHLEEVNTGAKEANRDMGEIETCLEIYTAVSEKGRVPGSSEFSIGGNVDEVIERIDEFIKSGVRHFSLMNLGPNLKEVEQIYGRRIIPYFKEEF
jgi:alkanesulfonate monooxygenase SsuD/methylene tetrahydromethanopterin reductase-like flavin-dependent oxidoreductase (luciferase family)